jgi:hypothetical protein
VHLSDESVRLLMLRCRQTSYSSRPRASLLDREEFRRNYRGQEPAHCLFRAAIRVINKVWQCISIVVAMLGAT